VQIFLAANHGKEMLTIETQVIALECVSYEFSSHGNASFLSTLKFVSYVYFASVAECFRDDDVVSACHASLPKTGLACSTRIAELQTTTTGIRDLRLRTMGVILGREKTAMMRSSISEHLFALIC
jgi:hypothetical protein